MYVIFPALPDDNIDQVSREENLCCDDWEYAVNHGYIWETKEQAQKALKAFTDFGKQYRLQHEN